MNKLIQFELLVCSPNLHVWGISLAVAPKMTDKIPMMLSNFCIMDV